RQLSGPRSERQGDALAARDHARYEGRTGGEMIMARLAIGPLLCVLCVLCVEPAAGGAQEPSAPQAVSAAQLQAAIGKLGDLDYTTRTDASRTVRRTAS